MALKTIDLAEIDGEYIPEMSYDEYREELQKPRAERRGLAQMPDDMSISGYELSRHQESFLAHYRRKAMERKI